MRTFLSFLAALAAVVCVATVLRAEPTAGKGRWEYRVDQLPADTKEADVAKVLAEKLAASTAEGWEYAGWVPVGSTYLLRRSR